MATAAALIADGAGNVLIVKPNYRDHWTLPGGICEFGEAPHAGCAREVAEEIGLELPVGRLLSVDWQLPLPDYGTAARPAVYFIFDCGIAAGRLPASGCRQTNSTTARSPRRPTLGRPAGRFALPRVRAAIAARSSGCTAYVPRRD